MSFSSTKTVKNVYYIRPEEWPIPSELKKYISLLIPDNAEIRIASCIIITLDNRRISQKVLKEIDKNIPIWIKDINYVDLGDEMTLDMSKEFLDRYELPTFTIDNQVALHGEFIKMAQDLLAGAIDDYSAKKKSEKIANLIILNRMAEYINLNMSYKTIYLYRSLLGDKFRSSISEDMQYWLADGHL
jgi:hypothetical protein